MRAFLQAVGKRSKRAHFRSVRLHAVGLNDAVLGDRNRISVILLRILLNFIPVNVKDRVEDVYILLLGEQGDILRPGIRASLRIRLWRYQIVGSRNDHVHRGLQAAFRRNPVLQSQLLCLERKLLRQFTRRIVGIKRLGIPLRRCGIEGLLVGCLHEHIGRKIDHIPRGPVFKVQIIRLPHLKLAAGRDQHGECNAAVFRGRYRHYLFIHVRDIRLILNIDRSVHRIRKSPSCVRRDPDICLIGAVRFHRALIRVPGDILRIQDQFIALSG